MPHQGNASTESGGSPGPSASGPGRHPSVELHIDELLLDGFGTVEGTSIGETFRDELMRLFERHGFPPTLMEAGQIERLDAGGFQVRPGAPPRRVGVDVASAVFEGMRR
jgi:hypothetical protein